MTSSFANGVLGSLPKAFREPLLEEYSSIVRNFLERRWSPSELSGGKFCEIVYGVLEAHSRGLWPSTPSKPKNFVAACRALEANTHVPRSFQILIPRLLPALYEIRNNRGVGHVGGDVDPNPMDAAAVVAMAGWVMAELVRVFHSLSVAKAQEIVDSLVQRRNPLVWSEPDGKLVLDPRMPLPDQVLLLLDASPGYVRTDDLRTWCQYKDEKYFRRLLRKLRDARLILLREDEREAKILPPGSVKAEEILAKRRVV